MRALFAIWSPREFCRGAGFFGVCFLFAWLEWQAVACIVGMFTS